MTCWVVKSCWKCSGCGKTRTVVGFRVWDVNKHVTLQQNQIAKLVVQNNTMFVQDIETCWDFETVDYLSINLLWCSKFWRLVYSCIISVPLDFQRCIQIIAFLRHGFVVFITPAKQKYWNVLSGPSKFILKFPITLEWYVRVQLQIFRERDEVLWAQGQNTKLACKQL